MGWGRCGWLDIALTAPESLGGNFDNLNNVECVYANSLAGEYEVRVIASEIGGNALTPFTSAGQQDFALVIDNARRVSD